MKNKRSLYLWVDDFPLCHYVNHITEHFFDGMSFKGCYSANQILTKSSTLTKQTFDECHSIAYGLNNIYEGWTIS